MFFKRRYCVIFRDFGAFGYITDNSNFRYKLIDEKDDVIGEKILSESGSVFFSALTVEPESIEKIAKRIQRIFLDVDIQTLIHDALEFFISLEQDGFVVSGASFQECSEKDSKFSYQISYVTPVKSTFNNEASIETPHNFLSNFYGRSEYLTSLHIEITGRCNERCVHCYIPHESKVNDIDSSLFYSILDQCRDLRLLHLTLSGGEPMLHRDFCNFLRRCREYEFSVSVLTNLTLLNDEVLGEMKANPLLGVQVSLYSLDASVHDVITEVKGSFERTMNGIRVLIENDIPMQISCPILKQNRRSYREVKLWAERYRIHVGDDFTIIAKYDHNTQNLQNRLSSDEVEEIIKCDATYESDYFERIEEDSRRSKNLSPNDPICSICSSSLCVTENGVVYPCAGWQDCILGNVHENSIEYIWNNSEKIKRLRNIRLKDFPKCTICPNRELCTMCMVRNANEDPEGNPLHVNEYFCNIISLYRKVQTRQK